MGSMLDQVYRSFVLSRFFSRGWGHPDHLKRLFEFRKNIANREACMKLVDADHPVVIDSARVEERGVYKVLKGHFRSPFAEHLPGLLPKVAETAHFELLLPVTWKSKDRPICIQMAGTGDHQFWRRRHLLAIPLAKEYGIGSLLLENPFYGVRKPKEQFRSSLLNVSDIFVMGGSLILEGIALLHWLEKEGFGPMCLHGISMGGHMASLAAVTWHKPVGLVPCLSWSTASGVFCQGVMSQAIDWKSLEHQFHATDFFKDKLFPLVMSNNDEAYLAGKEFASQYKKSTVKEDPKKEKSFQDALQSLTTFLRDKGLLKIIPDLKIMSSSTPRPANIISDDTAKEFTATEFKGWVSGHTPDKEQKEAIQFMRGVMDEFTHLKNFARPIDPELIIVIAARDDAYIPRDGYQPLDHLWPGCDIRVIDGGHISSYLLHQGLFKQTIAEAMDKYRQKYGSDGRLLESSAPAEKTQQELIEDVVGLQTPTKSPVKNSSFPSV